MLYNIPIQNIPNQTLAFELNNQRIELTLETRLNEQLYATISVNGKRIVANRVCLNLVPLIMVDYLPIQGNLLFMDASGSENPNFRELGSRFRLIWSEK